MLRQSTSQALPSFPWMPPKNETSLSDRPANALEHFLKCPPAQQQQRIDELKCTLSFQLQRLGPGRVLQRLRRKGASKCPKGEQNRYEPNTAKSLSSRIEESCTRYTNEPWRRYRMARTLDGLKQSTNNPFPRYLDKAAATVTSVGTRVCTLH